MEGEGWEWVEELVAGETAEEHREEVLEALRARIHADINERYTRQLGKTHPEESLRTRFAALLTANLIPYMLRKTRTRWS